MLDTKIKSAIFYADTNEAANLEEFGAILLRNIEIFQKKIAVYRYKKYNFLYINTGIGLINAAIFAQKIIEEFPIENLINYGACGANLSINFPEMEKQLVFPERFYLLDVKTPWYPPGKLPSEPEFYENNKIGKKFNLGSSNSFIFKKKQVKDFKFVHFFDMEAFAFAQTASKNKLNFYCVKYLTDQIESNTDKEMVNNSIKKGLKKAVEFSLVLLENI